MSQIDERLRALLVREPEIEKCYRHGLVNRRALARYAIHRGVAARGDLDAVVATIRRHDFGEDDTPARELFHAVRVGLKDRILVLEFSKEPELLKRVERALSEFDYSRGDTLKLVLGTAAVKLFVDESREPLVRSLLGRSGPRQRSAGLSEISMQFPDEASLTRNVLAVLTRELALNGVVIAELLTASPELLIYLDDAHVPKAYEVIRRLQAS